MDHYSDFFLSLSLSLSHTPHLLQKLFKDERRKKKKEHGKKERKK